MGESSSIASSLKKQRVGLESHAHKGNRSLSRRKGFIGAVYRADGDHIHQQPRFGGDGICVLERGRDDCVAAAAKICGWAWGRLPRRYGRVHFQLVVS